jgi:hypothetical protein
MKNIKTLTAEAEIIAGAIKRDVSWIILKRKEQTTQVFLNIIQFVNYMKLIYRATCKFKHHKQLISPHSNF